MNWTRSSIFSSLELGDPELNTNLQVQSYQCWEEGKDHLSWPAGSTLHSVAKNTTGLLSDKGTLFARVQLSILPYS